MKIVITGAEGFVGSFLAELALAKKVEVVGTVYPGAAIENIRHLKAIKKKALDIRNQKEVNAFIKKVQPDCIFHLAAQSNYNQSSEMAEQTLSVNILGSSNILEACRQFSKKTKILVIGSGTEYGFVDNKQMPITERFSLQPDNPYAISKVCQDLMGLHYFKEHGMHVVRVRPFNHIGPRQAPAFVCSDFARQIAMIEAGKQKPQINVGNLDVERDFTDVRDIVRAYWMLLQKGKAGEVYNLCSGKAIAIRTMLDKLLSYSDIPITIKSQTSRKRKNEGSTIYGNYKKLATQTSWIPTYTLDQTLIDTLNYWRTKIA